MTDIILPEIGNYADFPITQVIKSISRFEGRKD